MVKALRIILYALADPNGLNAAVMGLGNVIVRCPGLLATKESDDNNPPVFGNGGTGMVNVPQGPTISMMGSHFISDLDLESKTKEGVSTIEGMFQSWENSLVFLHNVHGMMTVALHLTCRAYGLSWTSLYLEEDVLQPSFGKYKDMRAQSSEIVMNVNDNQSEYGISLAEAIRDVYGVECHEGIRTMLSTVAMLINGIVAIG